MHTTYNQKFNLSLDPLSSDNYNPQMMATGGLWSSFDKFLGSLYFLYLSQKT